MSDNQTITLYPSSWVYNASIVGFLRVLSKCEINVEELFNKQHGTVSIPIEYIRKILNENEPEAQNYELLKQYKKWHWNYVWESYLRLREKVDKKIEKHIKEQKKKNIQQPEEPIEELKILKTITMLLGTGSDFYRNYLDSQEVEEHSNNKGIKQQRNATKDEKEKEYLRIFGSMFSSIVDKISSSQNSQRFQCNLCYRNTYETKEVTTIYSYLLFQSASTFQNSFWGNIVDAGMKICLLCRFLILHFYIGALNGKEKIFINTPNLFVTYKLNQLLENNTFLLSSMEFQIRILYEIVKYKSLLGYWSMSNIQLVRIDNSCRGLDFMDIPSNRLVILCDYEVVNIINKVGTFKFFEAVINLDFRSLEKLCYYALKYVYILLSNDSDISEEMNQFLVDYLGKDFLKGKDFSKLKYIFLAYPKLLDFFSGGKEVMNRQTEEIDNTINNLLNISINNKELVDSISKLSLVLIDQIRMGKKENVYHMLLRCFIVNQEKFPRELQDAFKNEYDPYFKILMFSFISKILNDSLEIENE